LPCTARSTLVRPGARALRREPPAASDARFTIPCQTAARAARTADQLLIEHHDFGVEDGRVRAQLRDRGGDLAEAEGVVDGVAIHESNRVLVRDDSPLVDLFLVVEITGRYDAVLREGEVRERFRGRGIRSA
jgi:hypothetical protein